MDAAYDAIKFISCRSDAMITLRLPRPVIEALKEEAHRGQTSLQQLCVRRVVRQASLERAAQLMAAAELAEEDSIGHARGAAGGAPQPRQPSSAAS